MKDPMKDKDLTTTQIKNPNGPTTNEPVQKIKFDTTNLKWDDILVRMESYDDDNHVNGGGYFLEIYTDDEKRKSTKKLKKRIKACLNFCAGIDTKTLKRHKLTDYIKDCGEELD